MREAIIATLETLAAGKISAKELPVPSDTRKGYVRHAPGFGPAPPAGNVPLHLYTIDGLARFLGETKERGEATESFKATFGALELIDGNGLKEGDIAGLEVWKIDAVVSHSIGQARCRLCNDTRVADYADVFHKYFEVFCE